MRSAAWRALWLLAVLPAVVSADPLGNMVQIVPGALMFLSIPAALVVWGLASWPDAARERSVWIATGGALLILVVLVGSAMNGSLFAGILLVVLVLVLGGPILLLFVGWCALWYFAAGWLRGKLPNFPESILMVLGSAAMVVSTWSVVWRLFPSECRKMFGG